MSRVVAASAWRARAACRGTDLDVWFEPGDSKDARALVQSLCVPCPVRQDCLDYALRVGCEDGWFGGLSARARRRIPRTGRVLTLVCDDCQCVFDYTIVSGGPYPARCRPCQVERDRYRKREYDEQNGRVKVPGSKPKMSIADGGHGRISKYVKKRCRCRACVVAAREQRARQRAAEALGDEDVA